MIITDTRRKLILFMYDKQLTQRQVAHELSISHEHLCRVLAGGYTISNRLHTEIENMFKRYGYVQALDFKEKL